MKTGSERKGTQTEKIYYKEKTEFQLRLPSLFSVTILLMSHIFCSCSHFRAQGHNRMLSSNFLSSELCVRCFDTLKKALI
jgi:hypothetical protein